MDFGFTVGELREAIKSFDAEEFAEFAKESAIKSIDTLFDFLGSVSDKFYLTYQIKIKVDVFDK